MFESVDQRVPCLPKKKTKEELASNRLKSIFDPLNTHVYLNGSKSNLHFHSKN